LKGTTFSFRLKNLSLASLDFSLSGFFNSIAAGLNSKIHTAYLPLAEVMNNKIGKPLR
jgi:hypothetical protein